MMKGLLITLGLLPGLLMASPTRTLNLTENDIGEIHTAMKYSTIVEFDTRPLYVILGDQDAFKVEYVGSSITIKPVLPSSSTNLFVMTDYDKFNFKIRTTSSDKADYKIKVKRKSNPSSQNGSGVKIHFRNIGKSVASNGVLLELSTIGAPKNKNLYLLTFSVGLLRNKATPEFSFSAQDFHIQSGKRELAIDSLSLSGLELSQDKPAVSGTLLIRGQDLKNGRNVTLQFSPKALGKKPLRLAVNLDPKVKEQDESRGKDQPVFSDGKLPF